ncbi:MAG: vWA domain-containing protein [Pseudobdellovibrionaceae bacterium]
MKTLTTKLIILSALVTACGVENPSKQGPVQNTETKILQASKDEQAGNPKVNILFVVDNSGSMRGYQQKMADNIAQFAETFFDNTRVDYKIGVVPVYDSKYLHDEKIYNSGKRKMNPLGELVKLKGLAEGDLTTEVFITRNTPNPKEVLKQTVLLGTQWGPEAEESFSPVIAIMDPTINSEKNQNFYDPEAHLAVIFLTDADDVSPNLSAEDFYNQLLASKKGDRSKILIAAAIPDVAKHGSSCTTDGRGPIDAIPTLMKISGGITADLCSNAFGARLTQFGNYLVQQLTSQKIPLGFIPDVTTLMVTYGARDSKIEDRQVIPRGSNGYFLDMTPSQPMIFLSPDLILQTVPGGVIWISAKPLNLSERPEDLLEL